MTSVRCPRCHREAPAPTTFCAGCGAPLLLEDEAPQGPLDAALSLDRRSRGAADGRPAPAPPPAVREPVMPPADLLGAEAEDSVESLPGGGWPGLGELAPMEKSSWDIGRQVPAADRSEPLPPEILLPPSPPRRNVAVPKVPPGNAAAEKTAIVGPPAMGKRTPAPPTATAASNPTAKPSTSTSTSTSTTTTTGGAGDPAPAPDPLAELDLPDPEVDALEVHVARAEPWRRAIAWAVDGLPFLAAGVGLTFVLLREAAGARGGAVGGLEDVIDLLSGERVIALSIAAAVGLALATYTTLAHALGGATLGKRLVGVRVVGPDGGPPSPARSAFRSLVAVISMALLGLGFLLALFTRSGRALHDLVARTWVVKAP